MYSVAFDEFRRALATESKDRAEILAAMWDHCFTLVQVCHSAALPILLTELSCLADVHMYHLMIPRSSSVSTLCIGGQHLRKSSSRRSLALLQAA